MARIESVAVGGYYKTPTHLIPLIAAALRSDASTESSYRSRHVYLVDPCAGDGEAVVELAKAMYGESEYSAVTRFYTCELEATRYEALQETVSKNYYNRSNALHGDAFCIKFRKNSGASLLYLNPPYDLDHAHKRLEHKFLVRFTETLANNGVLVFVVPHYALKASAEYLATEYGDHKCYRFPDGDFEAFKQVVLIAKKVDGLFGPDPGALAKIQAWAESVEGMPVLSASIPWEERTGVPEVFDAFHIWKLAPLDIKSLVSKARPWWQSGRSGALVPIPGIIPDLPVQDLLARTYPVAMPPRPAHIAAGIASGIFNGARVESSTPGLPPLLVKGVFDKEYRTVEEKKDKDGEVTGVVQVQQPKLVTTVFDTVNYTYHTLKPDTKAHDGIPEVSEMSIADLLKHYGDSLMGVMEAQCPVMYDPRTDADTVPLPPSPRRLFSAQAHAVRAIVHLLGGPTASKAKRRRKAAILLGEIGSGKTSVSLISAKAIGAKRVLVMCPPHLLQSWTNEVQATYPEAEVRILQSVSDVDDLARMTEDRTVIAVLSREVAKLGHAWQGVENACPKCGSPTKDPAERLAKKRARCEASHWHPVDPLAHDAVRLAHILTPYDPDDHRIRQILPGRFAKKVRVFYKSQEKRHFQEVPKAFLDNVLDRLITGRLDKTLDQSQTDLAITLALLCYNDDAKTAEVARRFLENGDDYYWDHFGRDLLFLLQPQSPLQYALYEEFKDKGGYAYHCWRDFPSKVEIIKNGVKSWESPKIAGLTISTEDGKIILEDKYGTADLRTAFALLQALVAVSAFEPTPACGEFLFQAIPEPRRVPLAHYIAKRHPNLFDLFIADEAHEYSNADSAQTVNANRLMALGMPTILMTGSIMNGYAESLFSNMWAVSPQFREEFDRNAKQRFVDRYGYRKRLVQEKDEKTGEVVEYGSMSDRVTRSERMIGNAPGVLPLFLLRHLLPYAVTLHKSDLAIDLPACKQIKHLIAPSEVQKRNYEVLKETLANRIRSDMFKQDLSGKLFGQLAELPSYLDRATNDVGNSENGLYEIRYPASIGGGIVAVASPIDSSTLLPKEQWMIDTIKSELAEGRNVMVFGWHVDLLPRLSRLIKEHTGEEAPILYADKVATGKRQAWIDTHIIKKKRRVMVANPVAIQTGLNNLVHFSTEIWMENPACNPATYRQAIGRVDRIGQKLETRIHFAVYAGTLQEATYDLLMHKVAVSVSTDGLDPESALQAAGVGEESYMAGLSIGKQLWNMIADDAIRYSKVDQNVYVARSEAPPETQRVIKRGVTDLLEELAS